MAAERYEVPRLAALFWSLADALGWHSLVLAGHSWGGSVAVHMAAASPERVEALVLVDSGHLDYGETPDADLTATLEALTAEAEGQRLHLADRAELVKELEVDPNDPIVDAFLEGMMDDGAGGLIARTLGSSRAAAMYHLMRGPGSRSSWPVIAATERPTRSCCSQPVPERGDALSTSGRHAIQGRAPLAGVRFVEERHAFACHRHPRPVRRSMVALWLQGARRRLGVIPRDVVDE